MGRFLERELLSASTSRGEATGVLRGTAALALARTPTRKNVEALLVALRQTGPAREAAEKAVKTQLLMDAIADDLDIQVGQNDLTERLVLMSRQYGIEPQQLLQVLQQNNQLPAMFADVRRGLTVAAVVEAATVTDTDGNVVDTSEFFGRAAEADAGVEGGEADSEANVDSGAEQKADESE